MSYINYIVIDGNHRVSAKKENGFSDISGIFYIPNSEKDFNSKLNYAFYLFYTEINDFTEQMSRGVKFKRLYNKSALKNFKDIL